MHCDYRLDNVIAGDGRRKIVSLFRYLSSCHDDDRVEETVPLNRASVPEEGLQRKVCRRNVSLSQMLKCLRT